MPPDSTRENPSNPEKKSRKAGSSAVTSVLRMEAMDDTDDAFDLLSKQLMEAREQLRTERLIFLVLAFFALDAYLLTWADGWGMVAFIILQILFMAIVANYLDIPSAKAVFSQLYAILNRR